MATMLSLPLSLFFSSRQLPMRFKSTLLGQYILCGSSNSVVNVNKGLIVQESFVNGEEEKELLSEVERTFRGMKYEYCHWDGVITGFRETEKSQWRSLINQSIINRLHSVHYYTKTNNSLDSNISNDNHQLGGDTHDQLNSTHHYSTGTNNNNTGTLSHVHVLDLAENGYISPHIDSIKFCGDSIAGISLLSDSVMRLIPEKGEEEEKKGEEGEKKGRNDDEDWIDILLPRYSLYVMSGIIRYKYTHQILPNEQSYFNNTHIPRSRRISVISRTLP